MGLKTFAGAVALAISVTFGATSSNAAVIDLGFSLDGSGSVGNFNFGVTRDALADALSEIPTSGANQYRVAITQFGSNVGTIVAPTIVTAGNIGNIQQTLRNASRIGGGTNTTGAVDNLVSLFQNDGGLGNTTLFNITTDGQPNNQTNVEAAALAAFNAGVDGISLEAIGGLSNSTLENMRRIASIGTTGVVSATGAILTDSNNIPNAVNQGFVVQVNTFSDYEAAIAAKVVRVVDDTGGGDPNVGVVPLPAGLPLLLAGLGGFGIVRRLKRKAA